MYNRLIQKIGLLFFLLITDGYSGVSGPPILPAYWITMETDDLDKLYRNPYSDDYYPAKLKIDTLEYDCQVRFRGASARDLPKKSWKVKFQDNNNIFNAEKINFNAEYRDFSIMRNHLTNALFHWMGSPAPVSEYVFLFVNDQRKGVMLKIEEIEEDFLDRLGFTPGSIYKARDHGANLAPLTKYYNYFYTWDKQVGNSGDYSELLMLLNRIFYLNDEQFENTIEKIINSENILNYFAVEFCIVGFDSFTKNYNLYLDRDGKNLMLFPWDNDATFGNNWDGTFREDFIDNLDGHRPDNQNWESLRYNLLFQRLMEYPQWRSRFQAKVDTIILDGFSYLEMHIDSVYNYIRRDVSQDPEKRGTNEDFENEIIRLKYFLSERRAVLGGKSLFQRNGISEIYCSNGFPSAAEPDVFFSVKLKEPQNVYLHYSYNFSNTLNSLQLFDDGLHGDFAAGDSVYGNTHTVKPDDRGIISFSFFTGDKFYYPANGLGYIANNRTHTFALNLNNPGIDVKTAVQINQIYEWQNNYFVEIKNKASQTIDVSYCHLKGKYTAHDVILPEGSTLGPSESLVITSNAELANIYFSDKRTFSQIYFDIEVGDTLCLLSPVCSELTNKICTEFSVLPTHVNEIVINEVNYNASVDFDAWDWVELFNPNPFPVDLSSWQFRDSDDAHTFYLPDNTVLEADSFLVLCRDADNFMQYYPDVKNVVGNFSFGLDGGGELIRLFDSRLNLVDSLRYDDDEPWPVRADGEGLTLELINPRLDNGLAASWSASQDTGGTPGRENSSMDTAVLDMAEYSVSPGLLPSVQNYPNPFNMGTTFLYEIAENGKMSLKIYSLQGRLVKTLVDTDAAKGIYSVVWNGKDNHYCEVASGIYFCLLQSGERVNTKKIMILR